MKYIYILILLVISFGLLSITSESNIQPSLVESYQDGYLINFNVKICSMVTMEDDSQTIYKYEQVFVSRNANRNEVISAIIHNVYSTDDELAIINNYQMEPGDTEIAGEYNAYRERRTLAKEIADNVIIELDNMRSK